MTSETELNDLVSAGLFGDAANKIDRLDDSTPAIRVLRAQLEVHVGTPRNGRSLAQQLLKGRLSHKERSACWELIGRVCLSIGEFEHGSRAMGRAFAEAALAHDIQIDSRLRSNYVHVLLHWVGVEAAALEISKLRQVALQAGDPKAMVAFHTLAAEIHARKGLTKAALASVEVAEQLLNGFDNLWQRGRLAILRSGLSMLQSDFKSALHWNEEALKCARRSGSRELKIPALANRAIVKLSLNELADATAAIAELTEELKKGGFSIAEIGVRDVEMHIAMAAGNLDAAEALDGYISNLISEVEIKDSYYELWHLLNRVKLLYRKNKPHEGVAIALDSIPRIIRLSDRGLLQRMKLVAAEGYGRIGKPEIGASLLAEAMADNPDTSLEVLAESFRVAGRLIAPESLEVASEHFERARRICEGIGDLRGLSAVEKDCQDVLALAPPKSVKSPAEPEAIGSQVPAQRTPHAASVERIYALIETRSYVPLLATETLSLIADSNAVQRACIFCTHSGRRELIKTYLASSPAASLADDSDAIRIPIGAYHDRHYEIVASPRRNASARATILSIERIVHSAVALANARQREREQSSLPQGQTSENDLGLICASDRTLDLIKTIRRVAASNITVLLTGETGVGKELFAKALHRASSRNEKIFLPFNCATVPRDTFESQLFGHRRGSFTGAHEDSPGVIRAAAGGTLFLDEIGEMSLEVQPKLLRFLESGEIQPLGDPKPKLVDVRVVAATNANLDQLVSDGRFREDLFYRLNVIRINVPPLRERREEIPALVDHFLERHGREFEKPMLRVADETLEYLVLYRWPGNVRQLANEIRRMVALAEPGSVLMPAHLSEDIVATRRTMPAGQLPRGFSEVLTRIDQPLAAAVEHVERAAIQRALSIADGHLDEAARMLGLSRKGLYLKRQRLRID